MSEEQEARILGPLVSRVLPARDRSWLGVVHQAGKPLLDSELNLSQEIQEDWAAQNKQLEVQSGVYLGDDSTVASMHVYTTRGIHFDTLGTPFEILRPNEIAIDPFKAFIKGYLVDVHSSRVNAGGLDGRFISVRLPSPPQTGSRQDLIFLEVAFVLIDGLADSETKPEVAKAFREGNRQFKFPTENPAHQIVDPFGQIETTKRIQIQYRIRVAEGVDFQTYPDGLGDKTIKGWGAFDDNNDSGFAFTHVWPGDCDYGLYRAGDGGEDCRNLLGTVDGFTWAIPLYGVHRRNRNFYNVHTNPNGSAGSLENGVLSDRPDCLLHDEVADRDLEPLFHFVAPQGLNFEEMAEDTFDRLVRGWLRTKWSDDWNRTAKGTIILQVDGISSAPQQGVFQLARPDGFRNKFTDAPCTTTVKEEFAVDEDINRTILGFVAACNRVTLRAPSSPEGTVISSEPPVMIWKTSGLPVVTVGPWSGLGTDNAFVEIDPSGAGYEASDDVLITYKIMYGKGNGLQHTPLVVHRFANEISNANIVEYGFGFVGTEQARSLCPCAEIDCTQPHWFDDVPSNLDSFPHREYRASFNGNGTNKVVLAACRPCDEFVGDWVKICGCDDLRLPYDLAGLGEFRLTTHPLKPIMPVVSIVRSGENTYEVTFCRPILPEEIISFKAYTKARVGGFDPQCRGLVYVVEPRLFVTDIVPAVDGHHTYVFESTLPMVKDLLTTAFGEDAEIKAFIYIKGVVVPICNFTFNTDYKLTVVVKEADHPLCPPPTSLTVCPTLSDKAEIYIGLQVAPQTTDKWQIFYDFLPYQGVGIFKEGDTANPQLDLAKHQFLIKANGEMVVNSRGSGSCECFCGTVTVPEGCTLFPVVSEMLPLPSCNHDSDLIGSPIKFKTRPGCTEEDLTFFGMYHNLQQTHRGEFGPCCTKDYRVGNMFALVPCNIAPPPETPCACICDVPEPGTPLPQAVRGVNSHSILYLKDRFRFVIDTYFGWRFPLIEEPVFYQGIWYAAVADRFTGEIYLVVLTAYFDTEAGCNLLHSKCGVENYCMAYDFYRVPGRPLATICPVKAVTTLGLGSGSGFGSGTGSGWWGSGTGSGTCGTGFMVLP